jgi:hypothetical protein
MAMERPLITLLAFYIETLRNYIQSNDDEQPNLINDFNKLLVTLETVLATLSCAASV